MKTRHCPLPRKPVKRDSKDSVNSSPVLLQRIKTGPGLRHPGNRALPTSWPVMQHWPRVEPSGGGKRAAGNPVRLESRPPVCIGLPFDQSVYPGLLGLYWLPAQRLTSVLCDLVGSAQDASRQFCSRQSPRR